MKRTKGLIKNLVKVDKDFELALNNLTDVVSLNSSAILALGSVDSSGTLTKLSELLNQSSNPLNNYSNNIFKSRQSLNQIIDLEQRWETVERDRELLLVVYFILSFLVLTTLNLEYLKLLRLLLKSLIITVNFLNPNVN